MNFEEIRQAYDRYRASRTAREEELRAEIRTTLDKEFADEVDSIREKMTEAHANGVGLPELRKAVRAYGNTEAWRFWWTATRNKKENERGE